MRYNALSFLVLMGCVGDPAPIVVPDSGGMDTSTMPDTAPPIDSSVDAGCPAMQVFCGGVCTDLQTSGDHCGDCSRSCRGGMCKDGNCVPSLVVGNLSSPTILRAVDSPALLVFVRAGKVARVAKAGGAVTDLWTSTGTYTLDNFSPMVLGAQDAFVYVKNGGNTYLARASFTDPSPPTNPQTVAADNGVLVAVENNHILFGNAYNVRSCLLSNCTGTAIKQVWVSSYVEMVAQEGGMPGKYLRWDGALYACDRQGPMTPGACVAMTDKVLAPVQSVSALQAVNGVAYWVQTTSNVSRVLACNIATGCGMMPKIIVEQQPLMGDMVVDGSGAYFTDPVGGGVRACQDLVMGCGNKPKTLAVAQSTPTGIATDGQMVYWTNKVANGNIMKVAK